MDTIQAAILIEKMKLFPNEIRLRQQVAQRYVSLLADYVRTPQLSAENTSVYAQFTIEVEDRNQFQANMQKQGIPTAVHYPIAMHQQPALAFLNYKKGDMPIAERTSERVVSLPMHPYLTSKEQEEVADAVKAALQQSTEVAV